MKDRLSVFPVMVSLMLLPLVAWADGDKKKELLSLSIEELMEVEVVTASKKEESVRKTAAAIYVLTEEDIRRSGANNIPTLLRRVPGLQVARTSNNSWSVTSRGFNGRFSNKLLVLVDGRSVYSPVFSGVFWDELDLVMEDIKRIEVIRGPGGTLWGANAVNGVINIITKKASETQGSLATTGGGTEERYFGTVRHGTTFAEKGSVRMFAKHNSYDNSEGIDGIPAYDGGHNSRVGFRADWDISPVDSLTAQGSIHRNEINQTYLSPTLTPPFSQTLLEDDRARGGDLSTRWSRRLENGSQLDVSFYYTRHDRDDTLVSILTDIYDGEVQHRIDLDARHSIVWGAGFRAMDDELIGGSSIEFRPVSDSRDVVNGFIQDEITLDPDFARLTIGMKVEHNQFTGAEFSPNARLLLTPSEESVVWGAISRAVRTPSRIENGVTAPFGVLPIPGFGPALGVAEGRTSVGTESLVAYEAGYRYSPASWINFDLATFWFDYSNLGTLEPADPALQFRNGVPTAPFQWANSAAANAYGGEFATNIQALENVRFQIWYAWMNLDTEVDADVVDILSSTEGGEIPANQAEFRTYVNLTRTVELDASLRYVDARETIRIPGYVDLDLRLGWRPYSNLELALIGQNLLHGDRREFSETFPGTAATAVQRGAYVKATVTF